MDSKSSTMSPQNSLDPDRSDRSSGEHVPSTPAVTDDTVEPSPARQPQNRVFTFFKLLPAELRLLIWKFACARPRIHFLEPIAIQDEESRGPFWHYDRVWREDYCLGRENTPRIHWESLEPMTGQNFQLSGRKLLSVCKEARKAFLDQENTLRREQLRGRISDMNQTTDIISIRSGFATRAPFLCSLIEGSCERVSGFCHPNERPSPRRLALEIPVPPDDPDFPGRFHGAMPRWLVHYGHKQKFMRFDQLETVYLLDRNIKPRSHYRHQGNIPPEMYTEAFDGHQGSKYVAIDPEDRQAVQFWTISESCSNILAGIKDYAPFSYMTDSCDADYNRRIRNDTLAKAKLRFLACVRESSQAWQPDDESRNSGFTFT